MPVLLCGQENRAGEGPMLPMALSSQACPQSQQDSIPQVGTSRCRSCLEVRIASLVSPELVSRMVDGDSCPQEL